MCFWYSHWARRLAPSSTFLAHYPADFAALGLACWIFHEWHKFCVYECESSLCRLHTHSHTLPLFNNFPLWLSGAHSHTHNIYRQDSRYINDSCRCRCYKLLYNLWSLASTTPSSTQRPTHTHTHPHTCVAKFCIIFQAARILTASGMQPAGLPGILPSQQHFQATCATLLFYAIRKFQVPEGGRGGVEWIQRVATRCLLMHTCSLVLSPFYILDENVRKLSFVYWKCAATCCCLAAIIFLFFTTS